MIGKSIASALLSAAFLITPALAEEPAGEALSRTITVHAAIALGDLDLGTPAGAAEANSRVTRMVREICRPTALPGPGRGRIDGHCFRQAMASARRQIDQAVVARRGEAGVQTALANPRPGASEE